MALKLADRTLTWLLAGDPAIRWQVLRDLVGAASPTVQAERQRVVREGWGARLLQKQDAAGTWAGGLYSPKWLSTTYTMLLLRDIGVPAKNPQALRACAILLDRGLQPDGGIDYGRKGRSETCITGMVLSLLSHFEYDDTRLDTIAGYLLHQQMPDGGWNCQRPLGATHSSVHTTISVLEGLRLYEINRQFKVRSLRAAQRRGREFLLMHQLFRSDRTGDIIKRAFLQFSFPPRWHYDVLRALDYFQAVNAPRDERLRDALDVVSQNQCSDGRWLLKRRYKGKTFFEFERLGAPSRWNTLRSLRVLRWWQGDGSIVDV
jgi:hypothetical protein